MITNFAQQIRWCSFRKLMVYRHTCVHVENGKTESGGEVPYQGQDHNRPVGGIFISLYEEGEEEHDPGGDGARHVGILPAHLQGEDHGQRLGREVQDGSDDEVEEEAAGEVLPGEGEAVHDEGRGEPVEVHDDQVEPEGGMFHDVQETPLGGTGARLGQHDLVRLHGHPVLLAGVGQNLLGLLYLRSREER